MPGRMEDPTVILTVTPNASIDKTYVVEGFGVDRIHRPSKITSSPGGKGINVLRVFKELGGSGIATGFVGGRVGEAILEGLDAEGLEHSVVKVQGESRLCLKVIDPLSGTQTEINETGPDITQPEVEQLSRRIEELLDGMEWLVLSGNVPPGVPEHFYTDMIKLAKSRGVKTVLDASDQQLKEGVAAGPYMIKPNVHELSELAEQELVTVEEICAAAKNIIECGINIVAVTVGRSGALVTDGQHAWQAVPPDIEYASAVGSGDSFIAGFLSELAAGGLIPEALVLGTAAGAANATTYNAGSCSKCSIMDIRRGVSLSELF